MKENNFRLIVSPSFSKLIKINAKIAGKSITTFTKELVETSMDKAIEEMKNKYNTLKD